MEIKVEARLREQKEKLSEGIFWRENEGTEERRVFIGENQRGFFFWRGRERERESNGYGWETVGFALVVPRGYEKHQ